MLNKGNPENTDFIYSKEFWTKVTKPKIKYIINPSELKMFLESNGFYRYELADTYKVVYLRNGISKEVTPQDMFNFCYSFIEIRKTKQLSDDFFRQGETYLIAKKGILGSLKTLESQPIKDKKDKSYIFYENCFVEISPQIDFKKISYIELNNLEGFVWQKSILKRKFVENEEESIFEKFLKKITNNDLHFESIVCAIGYLLHRFKDPSINKAVIISDENTENENQANGRTGKGLIISAIGKFINISIQNGKNIDLSNNKFAYQNVDLTTDLIFLDDVKRNFSFEQLFSILTNDMVIEQKNKPSYTIPFSMSPKLALTTNYIITGNSSSHNGRRLSIFLNNYFNDKHTPKDEFNTLFFDEWDNKEWQRFDTFMLSCLRQYLTNGIKEYENQELKLKQLKKEISETIYDILNTECNEIGKFYKLKELGKNTNSEIKSLKPIEQYAEFKNLLVDKRTVAGCTEFKFITK